MDLDKIIDAKIKVSKEKFGDMNPERIQIIILEEKERYMYEMQAIESAKRTSKRIDQENELRKVIRLQISQENNV